jgi:hypothetical protein
MAQCLLSELIGAVRHKNAWATVPVRILPPQTVRSSRSDERLLNGVRHFINRSALTAIDMGPMHSRRAAFLSLCLACAACGGQREDHSSVTVKLPPARPYTPEPSFSFGRQTTEIPVDKQAG